MTPCHILSDVSTILFLFSPAFYNFRSSSPSEALFVNNFVYKTLNTSACAYFSRCLLLCTPLLHRSPPFRLKVVDHDTCTAVQPQTLRWFWAGAKGMESRGVQGSHSFGLQRVFTKQDAKQVQRWQVKRSGEWEMRCR